MEGNRVPAFGNYVIGFFLETSSYSLGTKDYQSTKCVCY